MLTSEESPYKNYEIRQEYPVSSINPDYDSNRERFDWAILGHKVVIEVHGKQHYAPVCFGGITLDKAKRNFLRRLELDQEKQEAAEEALWAYVVGKYDEKNITLEQLTEKVTEALRKVSEGVYIQKKPKAKIQSRGFQKREGKYKWPTRKIQSRKNKEDKLKGYIPEHVFWPEGRKTTGVEWKEQEE
jgi:hypothetical protein